MGSAVKVRRRQTAAVRRNRVAVTLTDGELLAYRAAAAADGVAVAAWLARAGNDKASGLSVPAPAELRKAVAELGGGAVLAGHGAELLRQRVLLVT
jgi:hypothetical protein